ncbi:hypothetical protein FDP41_008712 [Naegleria fowleri]|uniref:Uncharacterized protein n=1 Tax=Naegleria fowleri TaxID=5763 RepID=A0A6A5BGE1_NAEFO|nr:uncharacterized protein FDP41_008712 [Naegleria fowleri]KAF0973048.1 hypothetical protein FDP41_008712 [Naegleria fowleri]
MEQQQVEEAHVVVEMISDFSCRQGTWKGQAWIQTELWKKFMNRMRQKPFNLSFRLQYELKSPFENVNFPIITARNVKISYNQSCILLLDSSNYRILVFNLYTKQFKKTIHITQQKFPVDFCVEENFDQHVNDAILVACECMMVFKFSLTEALQSPFDYKCKWRTEEDEFDTSNVFEGIAILQTIRQVYVCDSRHDVIHVLELETGKKLFEIQLCENPHAICISNDEQYMFISEISNFSQYIHKFERMNDGNELIWKKIANFGQKGSEPGEFLNPYFIVLDPTMQQWLLVSDYYNNRLQILNATDGQVVKVYGSKESKELYHPLETCFDRLTGELIVCENNRVLIFK